jgi:putative sigma-54 modulation protein
MKINVRAHHISVTNSLRDYAQKKMEKLETFYDRIIDVSVELDMVDSSDENQRQLATININVPGSILRASEVSKDMYASIDLLFEKAEAQIKKFKEKLRDHKKPSHKQVTESIKAADYSKPAQVSMDKLYVPKPMAPEDAALFLNDSGQPFLMFRNIRSEKINVLYKMDDKTLGLIEP